MKNGTAGSIQTCGLFLDELSTDFCAKLISASHQAVNAGDA
jgi:hypothetical protein